jgi:hypothetical protein
MVERLILRSSLLIAFSTLVVGCNFPSPQVEFTSDGPATIAAYTLEAVFTNVAIETDHPSDGTPQPGAAIAGTSTETPVTTCTNKAAFVDDITVRDNTQIETEGNFIKIWRLRNVGTCIWNQSYELAFMGGERMGAPLSIPLTHEIQPGQSVDLAIDMTAPDRPGVYQGFWRLRSDNGNFFGIGDGGDQSFWVKIVAVVLHTASPSATVTSSSTPATPLATLSTATPSKTPEPTVAVYKQGATRLDIDQSVDLDRAETDPLSGEDLQLAEAMQEDLSLVPVNGALLAFYSGETTPPGPLNCISMPLAGDSIPMTSLAVNDILCYSTDEGRLGYLLITSLNSTIFFNFTTWVP